VATFWYWFLAIREQSPVLSPEQPTGEVSEEQPIEEEIPAEEVPEEEPQEIILVTVKENLTKWLKAREGPGTSYSQIGWAYPGESYILLEEQEGWYKIILADGTSGWVSASYSYKTIKNTEL